MNYHCKYSLRKQLSRRLLGITSIASESFCLLFVYGVSFIELVPFGTVTADVPKQVVVVIERNVDVGGREGEEQCEQGLTDPAHNFLGIRFVCATSAMHNDWRTTKSSLRLITCRALDRPFPPRSIEHDHEDALIIISTRTPIRHDRQDRFSSTFSAPHSSVRC